MRNMLNGVGRVGCVLPTGIATDDTTKFFFQDVVETKSLASLYDFENEESVFRTLQHAYKVLPVHSLAAVRTLQPSAAEFVFFARQIEDLRDPERRFHAHAEDIALLNPNTRTCPIFRSKRDAEINKAIYRRVPVLIEEVPPERNPWGISFYGCSTWRTTRLFRT